MLAIENDDSDENQQEFHDGESSASVLFSWVELRERQRYLNEIDKINAKFKITRIMAGDGSELAIIFTGTTHIKKELNYISKRFVHLPWYDPKNVIKSHDKNHGNFANKAIDLLEKLTDGSRTSFSMLSKCSNRYSEKQYQETVDEIVKYVMTVPLSDSDYGKNRERRVVLRDSKEIFHDSDMLDVFNLIGTCLDMFDACIKNRNNWKSFRY